MFPKISKSEDRLAKYIELTNDRVGVLEHQQVGLRDRCRDIEASIETINVRLGKLEKHVYPAKRVLQGHKR